MINKPSYAYSGCLDIHHVAGQRAFNLSQHVLQADPVLDGLRPTAMRRQEQRHPAQSHGPPQAVSGHALALYPSQLLIIVPSREGCRVLLASRAAAWCECTPTPRSRARYRHQFCGGSLAGNDYSPHSSTISMLTSSPSPESEAAWSERKFSTSSLIGRLLAMNQQDLAVDDCRARRVANIDKSIPRRTGARICARILCQQCRTWSLTAPGPAGQLLRDPLAGPRKHHRAGEPDFAQATGPRRDRCIDRRSRTTSRQYTAARTAARSPRLLSIGN